MEKISALVIDDEPNAREGLHLLLATDPDIEVLHTDAFGNEALPVIEKLCPKLLFLDIQMPGKNGFQIIEELEIIPLPIVVFVTAYDQYALKAFEVNAVDYILKPFSDDRFFAVLNKVKQAVAEKKSAQLGNQLKSFFSEIPLPSANQSMPKQYLKKLLVKKGNHLLFVDVASIDSIEANDYYLIVYEGKHQHLLRASLNSIAEQLDPAQFLRIHRSVIVNVDRIRSIESHFNGEYRVNTSDGKSFKMSRYRKEDILNKLGLSH